MVNNNQKICIWCLLDDTRG